MSARDRNEKFTRAVREGALAFAGGTPKSACPYKVSNWGLGNAWLMGWERAQQDKTVTQYHQRVEILEAVEVAKLPKPTVSKATR